MTDLTNKTFADLRSIVEYNTEPENNAEAQEYADAWVEIARRAQANDAMRATLSNWCVQFGAALCPTAGSADSFGDGMRAAKKQVSRILAAAPTAASSGAPAPSLTASTERPSFVNVIASPCGSSASNRQSGASANRR